MTSDIAGELRNSALFEGLPDTDLQQLARQSRSRSYRKGHLVFSTGDPSDALVVVVSGQVKVVARSADGGELMLTILKRGSTFGELGVIDGGLRSADAEMLEAGDLILIPREALRGLLSQSQALSTTLLERVAADLRRLTDATADLVFLDLPRRVAKFLLDQPRDSSGLVELTLNQEQIATLVGGSRQSVNTTLRGFERRGWIATGKAGVHLRDISALSRFAG